MEEQIGELCICEQSIPFGVGSIAPPGPIGRQRRLERGIADHYGDRDFQQALFLRFEEAAPVKRLIRKWWEELHAGADLLGL